MALVNEQITDHEGNSLRPTKDQLKLYKAGWRIVSITKRGMYKLVKWRDPQGGMMWPQTTAIQILKVRALAKSNG